MARGEIMVRDWNLGHSSCLVLLLQYSTDNDSNLNKGKESGLTTSYLENWAQPSKQIRFLTLRNLTWLKYLVE